MVPKIVNYIRVTFDLYSHRQNQTDCKYSSDIGAICRTSRAVSENTHCSYLYTILDTRDVWNVRMLPVRFSNELCRNGCANRHIFGM